MLVFIWIVTAVLLGLWSLAAWGIHALLSLDPSWVGDIRPLIDQIPYGAVIEQWIPGWRELLQATVDLTQVVLGWLGGAAPWLAWLVWGAGAAGLVLLAGFLTLVVVLLRPKPTPRAA
jgi:hypothetical protein